MDLFDSATPEMKRMRNQRKDSNVLAGMRATSSNVEPAEISYHANGEFRGSRDIFGSLSPVGSPVRFLYVLRFDHSRVIDGYASCMLMRVGVREVSQPKETQDS